MPKPYYEASGITIYHGDCLDVIGYLTADVLVTDPPYGISFNGKHHGAFADETVLNDESSMTRDIALEIWGRDRPALIFGRWSIPKPPKTRMCLTWEKGEHVGMGDLELPWKPNTEEIYVRGSGFAGRRGGSVVKVHAMAGTVANAARGNRFHVTEKPVGIMTWLLQKCPVEWTILDPFMGSGTTLRAAKDLGRRAIGIEIEERYCEIAARRMSQEVLTL